MRQLIVQEWISLDGFATDKQDKLDFFAPTVRDTYQEEEYAIFLKTIDCILFGRNTYNQFSALWPSRNGDILSDMINNTEKIVFSKSLRSAPWGKWKPAMIENGDTSTAIRKLKSRQGQNIVIWGSLSVVQEAARERLVDQYHLHICPIITGGGRKLFVEGSTQALTLLQAKQTKHGVVSIRYAT